MLKQTSIYKIPNVRLFIAFRALFNARFYYPVFAIMFLDFGLTLAQFTLLNAVWAVTIVLLEVPSGAMADIVGRRKLLIFSAWVMIAEMALICFAPRNNMSLLFFVFLINRILSGAAEASASGADEAIVYDTLKKEGRQDEWPRVLEREMRIRAAVNIGAMLVGAAVYDPDLMQNITHALGWSIELTQHITLRFPLFLTLFMAVATLVITLKMREVEATPGDVDTLRGGTGRAIMDAFKLTLSAGKWILQTPFALMIILAGLMFDHCIRMVITLGSQYYRLIKIPEASFGLIAAFFACLGLFVPRLAYRLAQKRTPLYNLNVMAGLTLAGLMGLTWMLPFFGLLPMLLLGCVMFLLNYFISYYLNPITSSEQRATVLSFKALAFKLGYGFIGVLYALLIAFIRNHESQGKPLLTGLPLENLVFVKSLTAFPVYFLFIFGGLLWYGRYKWK